MIYSNLSEYYNKWSTGDKYYASSGEFYTEEASKYKSFIAELGVGTGRIAEEIIKKSDCHIIGVDNCKEMLIKAGERLEKYNPNRYSLLDQDFRYLDLPIKCEYIYMPFRTFGHLENDKDRLATLQAVKRNLVDGGIFIFDHYVLDREWAESVADTQIVLYSDDNIRITDEYSFEFEKEKMHCTVRCNDEKIESFDFYWFKVEAIRKLIEEAGFKVKKLYGDFDRSNYTTKSNNQIWVLEN